jgi:hypothetical protein
MANKQEKTDILLENIILSWEVEYIHLLLDAMKNECRKIENGLIKLAENRSFVRDDTSSQENG